MTRPRYDVILDYFFAFLALFGVFIAGIVLWITATVFLAVAN